MDAETLPFLYFEDNISSSLLNGTKNNSFISIFSKLSKYPPYGKQNFSPKYSNFLIQEYFVSIFSKSFGFNFSFLKLLSAYSSNLFKLSLNNSASSFVLNTFIYSKQPLSSPNESPLLYSTKTK